MYQRRGYACFAVADAVGFARFYDSGAALNVRFDRWHRRVV